MQPFLNGLRVGAVEAVFGLLSVGKRSVSTDHGCAWVQGYVAAQSPLTDSFGHREGSRHPWGKRGSVEANGCGVIAVYNLLLGLGSPVPLDALLSELEQAGAPAFGGRLGSGSRVLARTLRSRGLTVKKMAGSRNWFRYVEGAEGLLFLYRHSHGFHYVSALRGSDGVYTLWNDNVAAPSGTRVTPEGYAGLLRRTGCGMYELLTVNRWS